MVSKSLVVDASTNVFQVGILAEDRFLEFFSSPEHTLTGFFSLLTSAMHVGRSNFKSIIFCQGPGKLNGIRATLMFVHILKIVRPEIKVYSYTSLALAHRIRNPLSLDDLHVDWNPENDEDEKWEKIAAELNDKDEIDAIEFRKSLKTEVPDGPIVPRKHLFEDIVCVPKNNAQFYIYSEGKILLVGRESLEMQESPVYCLSTSRDQSKDSMLIPMEYNIEECAEIIRLIATESSEIETEFDPQNEYQKWDHVRHQ